MDISLLARKPVPKGNLTLKAPRGSMAARLRPSGQVVVANRY
jgi:hypothetical protein